jgi:hypothetical protein
VSPRDVSTVLAGGVGSMTGSGVGVAALRIGVGRGLALVLER